MTMIKLDAVLRNAFNGETFIFTGRFDDPGEARFDVVLEPGGSGVGNALWHVHPPHVRYCPPLMVSVAPVMKAASSLAR